MKLAKLTAIALTFTLAGATAYAGGRSHGGKRHSVQDKVQRALQKFDANHDGALDATELEAMYQARMNRRALVKQEFDSDGDGKLSPQERAAARRALGARRATKMWDRLMSRHDSNGDGALAWTELSPALAAAQARKPHMAITMEKRFRTADADNNGIVTRAEFMATARSWRRGRVGRGHKMRGHGMRGDHQPDGQAQ